MPRGGKRKGAGRKRAIVEQADIAFLAKMFFEKHDKNQIQDLIKTGKYSISDAMLVNALSGREKVQIAIFNKLFPDKPEGEGTTKPIINIIVYNERDKHTLQVRSQQKAISIEGLGKPGTVQVSQTSP